MHNAQDLAQDSPLAPKALVNAQLDRCRTESLASNSRSNGALEVPAVNLSARACLNSASSNGNPNLLRNLITKPFLVSFWNIFCTVFFIDVSYLFWTLACPSSPILIIFIWFHCGILELLFSLVETIFKKYRTNNWKSFNDMLKNVKRE